MDPGLRRDDEIGWVRRKRMTAVFDNGVRPCPVSSIPLALTLSHEGRGDYWWLCDGVIRGTGMLLGKWGWYGLTGEKCHV